jgi:peptide/nickel transport system substrate-binding protein
MAGMSFVPTCRLFWGSLAAAFLIIAMLSGCSFVAERPVQQPTPDAETLQPTALEPSPTPGVAGPPTATPLPQGGNLTLRLAADVAELRPWQPRSRGEEQVTAMLYNGLMRLDNELRPVPDLAESWETTPDGRTLTFTLRSDLTWHDGVPLEAEDVLFTLEQLRSLPLTSTALLADLRYIGAATAPTSSTVVITLTSRFAPVLAALAVPVLPRHLLEDRAIDELNFWEVPVGSGPFMLAERQPGQSYVLERNERFHRGAPVIERVAFVVAPDDEVAIEALADERLLLTELAWGTQSAVAQASPETIFGAYPENGYYFLGFNLREGRPFADPRVREALALAVDMPRLVESVTKGQGILVGSSALPGSWADLTPPPAGGTDLDAARELLDDAGWTLPQGATLRQRRGDPLTVSLYVRGDDERRVLAARQIAASAAAIGMQIEVEPADFGSVLLSRYAPPFDFDLLLGSWSNGAGDPDYADVAFYDPDDFALFHSSQLNQGETDERSTRNFVGYSDPGYDNQAQAARQLYNLDERVAAISQAQARIAADQPYLFLWVDRIPVAISPRLTTLDGPIDLESPLYYWNIERWYLAP